MYVIDQFYLTFLEKNDGIDNLRNDAKLDSANQTLECIDAARRVHDANHPHSRESHVSEGLEVVSLAHLVINRVVWSHEQKDVGRLSHITFERRIPVSYTHLRAHETGRNLVCRLLLEKKKKTNK